MTDHDSPKAQSVPNPSEGEVSFAAQVVSASPSVQCVPELLDKLSETRPIPTKVAYTSKDGKTIFLDNTEYPQCKGECLAEDYGMWIYQDVLPNLLPYIRSQEAELNLLRSALTTIHNGGCPTLERCMVVAGKALFPSQQ